MPVADSGPTLGTQRSSSQQMVVKNCGEDAQFLRESEEMASRALHDVRSKVLYGQCRPRQQCQGEVIVKAFSEPRTEEEQRGETPPRLDDRSLCQVEGTMTSRLGRYLRGRLASLRAGDKGAPETQSLLCRIVT